jgi:hypothetical protein
MINATEIAQARLDWRCGRPLATDEHPRSSSAKVLAYG